MSGSFWIEIPFPNLFSDALIMNFSELDIIYDMYQFEIHMLVSLAQYKKSKWYKILFLGSNFWHAYFYFWKTKTVVPFSIYCRGVFD